MSYQWSNSQKTAFTIQESDTHFVVVDETHPMWSQIDHSLITSTVEDAVDPLAELRSGMRLSFAQLLIGLVKESWITQAEGTAWLIDRTPPAPVTDLINQLPADQQFTALARAVAPFEVLRLDPLVIALGSYTGKTPEQIDTFFQTYRLV